MGRGRELSAIERGDRAQRIAGDGIRAHLREAGLLEPLARAAGERAPPFEVNHPRTAPLRAEGAVKRPHLLDVARNRGRVLHLWGADGGDRSEGAERRLGLVRNRGSSRRSDRTSGPSR